MYCQLGPYSPTGFRVGRGEAGIVQPTYYLQWKEYSAAASANTECFSAFNPATPVKIIIIIIIISSSSSSIVTLRERQWNGIPYAYSLMKATIPILGRRPGVYKLTEFCYKNVCPSALCLSHSWATSKQFNISKYALHHTIKRCLISWGQISQITITELSNQLRIETVPHNVLEVSIQVSFWRHPVLWRMLYFSSILLSIYSTFPLTFRSLFFLKTGAIELKLVQNGLYSLSISWFRNLTQGHKMTAIRNYARTLQRGSLHTVVTCS